MLVIDNSIMTIIESNIRMELYSLRDIAYSLKECAERSALVGETQTKARAEVAIEYTSLVEDLQAHFNELSSFCSLVESYMHNGDESIFQEDEEDEGI